MQSSSINLAGTGNAVLKDRRRALMALLGAFGTAGVVAYARQAKAACELPILLDGFEAMTKTPSALAAAKLTIPAGTCVLIPSETQGPYPLLSVLSNPAIVRSDIREARPGIPLRLRLLVVNLNNGCAPITNAAVYIWQCDRDGLYSGYSQPGGNTTGQIFCRGIQPTDCNGEATFLSMYPGWYPGRITHMHFQIYLNALGTLSATSQLAFPTDVTAAVYASSSYPRGQNTSVTSFAQDNVFSDGVTNQMVSITGNITDGYDATLTIGVAI